MKGFARHIDHINWISFPENIKKNVSEMEALTGLKLQHLNLPDFGFEMYMSWEGGIGIVAPLGDPGPRNQFLFDWLNERGEGVRTVVFGVADIEGETERLAALGYDVGQEMNDAPHSPWHGRVNIRERGVTEVMNTTFTLGNITYDKDVIDTF